MGRFGVAVVRFVRVVRFGGFVAFGVMFLLGLGASAASALSLDARIVGIYTDSTLATPAPGATVNAAGDVYNYQMNAGEFIRIDVTIANPEGDLIEAVRATLIYQGDELDFLGANAPGSIFQEPGIGGASLLNFGTGFIKGNAPNPPGGPGDIWVQAVSYGAAAGSVGTGPDTVSLFFVVTGAANSGIAQFDLGQTSGDLILGASSTTFSGALITVVPEPSAMLLIGLGLAGLSHRARS